MKSVLITGATGFLGRRFLLGSSTRPWKVRALTRRELPLPEDHANSRVEWLKGCLNSGEGLEEALGSVDAVVHAAGGGRVFTAVDYERNNTETTQTLLRTIQRVNPQLERFILVSSMAARGPFLDGRGPGPVSLYGRSKAKAEELVQAVAEELPVTVLRPPAIYGPGDDRLIPLIKAVRRGRVILPKSTAKTSWVHVDDCISALFAILDTPHGSGQVFEIEDGEPLTSGDLIAVLAEGMALPSPSIMTLPLPVLNAVALLVETSARIFNQQALLTRDKLKDVMGEHWVQDRTAMEQQFQWRPHTTFRASYPWESDASFQGGETKKQ